MSWHIATTEKRRYNRLKRVFEGRKTQLQTALDVGTQPQYAIAVVKYTRARNKWRAFRGWK